MELESTTKALVLTRVSTSQMQNITPLHGAMVYNTDTQCIHYFNGSQWNNLCNNSGSGSTSVVDNGNGTYTFTNGVGSPITFYGAAETTTTLINNLDGTYTYTNENGAQTTFSAGGANQNLTTNGTSGSIGIDGGNTITLNVDDADADAGNEIQDLQYAGGIISLTNDPDATTIDLSAFDTDATDDFSGDFTDLTNVPVNLDTDATDDFDGEWTSLANRPAGLDDGDDDTQLTDAQVATAVNSEFPNLDTDATDDFSGDFTDLTNVPVNLDTDSTDDFDGEWTSLANRPAGLDDGDDDTQLTDAQVATAVSYNDSCRQLSTFSIGYRCDR